MSIVNYAAPEYRYYDTDRKIMEDYDNRIDIYNTALGDYNTQAAEYQKLVDDFNTNQIEPWNANLAQWQKDRELYNAAIEKWNATDRTTPYESWSGTVKSPGNFTSTAPVFEGGAAPVAPDDPGFAGEDVDAFIEEAQARAQRRGAANATAQAVIGNTSGAFGSGAGEQLVRDGAGSAGFQAGDINLAGNAGLSSTAMGFGDGGMVQNYAQGGAIASRMPPVCNQLIEAKKEARRVTNKCCLWAALAIFLKTSLAARCKTSSAAQWPTCAALLSKTTKIT